MPDIDDLSRRLRKRATECDSAIARRIEKAKEEMRKTSAQIYNLTDEVTKKNKGKLPDGWWEKK